MFDADTEFDESASVFPNKLNGRCTCRATPQAQLAMAYNSIRSAPVFLDDLSEVHERVMRGDHVYIDDSVVVDALVTQHCSEPLLDVGLDDVPGTWFVSTVFNQHILL